MGSCLLPIGPMVHAFRKMFAPGCLADRCLTLAVWLACLWQVLNLLCRLLEISLLVRVVLGVMMKKAVLHRALGCAANMAMGLLWFLTVKLIYVFLEWLT